MTEDPDLFKPTGLTALMSVNRIWTLSLNNPSVFLKLCLLDGWTISIMHNHPDPTCFKHSPTEMVDP